MLLQPTFMCQTSVWTHMTNCRGGNHVPWIIWVVVHSVWKTIESTLQLTSQNHHCSYSLWRKSLLQVWEKHTYEKHTDISCHQQVRSPFGAYTLLMGACHIPVFERPETFACGSKTSQSSPDETQLYPTEQTQGGLNAGKTQPLCNFNTVTMQRRHDFSTDANGNSKDTSRPERNADTAGHNKITTQTKHFAIHGHNRYPTKTVQTQHVHTTETTRSRHSRSQ